MSGDGQDARDSTVTHLLVSDGLHSLPPMNGAETLPVVVLPPPQAVSSEALLNPRVARAISTLSRATRLSLNCSAFLVECFFEGAKYGTQTGLNVSRRALVAAIASARDLHQRTQTTDPASGNAAAGSSSLAATANDTFYQVLDKYTNLGVYYVHSAFSLTELFAMTGVHLTASTLTGGIRAADESVRILDGLFGSTETSRALAAFVGLVKQEVCLAAGQQRPQGLLDPAVEKLAKAGTIRTMAGVLKALVAYACLQAVTWRRRQLEHVSVLVHQCEVLDGVKQPGPVSNTNLTVAVTSPPEAGQEQELPHRVPTLMPNMNSELFDDAASVMTTTTVVEQEILWELESMVNDLVTENDTEHVAGASATTTTAKMTTTTTTTTTTSHATAAKSRPFSEMDAQQQAAAMNGTSGIGYRRRTLSRRVSLEGSFTNGGLLPDASLHVTDIADDLAVYADGEGHAAAVHRRHTSISSIAHLHSDGGGSVIVQEVSEDSDEYPSSRGGSSWSMIESADSGDAGGLQQRTPPPLPPRSPVIVEPPSDSDSDSAFYSMGDNSQGRERSKTLPMPRSRLGLGSIISSVNNTLAKQTRKVRVKMGSGSDRSPRQSAIQQQAALHASQPTETPLSTTVAVTATSSLSDDGQHGSTGNDVIASQRPTDVAACSQLVPRAPHSAISLSTSANDGVLTCTRSDPSTRAFPRMTLTRAAQRFMHYSSAAYGPGFLNLLGMSRHHPIHLQDARHPTNHATFARHIGIPLDDVLHSSYTQSPGGPLLPLRPQMHALVHYVCIDRTAQAVVLTLRGTLGLSDVLTDLMCSYAEIRLNGQPYHTHSGMLESARLLAGETSEVLQHVRQALECEPTFGLIVCGHSLGGGVAALLSLLWTQLEAADPIPNTAVEADSAADNSTDVMPVWPPARRFVTSDASLLPPGRPVRCFAYASPCIGDTDLCRYARGLVTTVVHGDDIVPTLSLGVLHDFKAIAVSLYAEHGMADDIIARCIGLRQGKPPGAKSGESVGPGTFTRSHTVPNYGLPAAPGHEKGEDRQRPMFSASHNASDESDWYWSLIKTLRADMTARKLYPTGDVYMVESSHERYIEPGNSKPRDCIRARMMHVRRVEDRFGELIFAKRMFSDHSPTGYEQCLDALAVGTSDD